MAVQRIDCNVPLKVFSFRDNTDYSGIRGRSESPLQRVTHFLSLLYFKDNNTDQILKEFGRFHI